MSGEQEKTMEWARTVRSKLGLSQSQLAGVIGVSSRAVQSYEQGWRALPRPVAAHLMTLVALHGGHPSLHTPCWRQTGCPEEKRGRCPAYKVGRGHFCWLLSGGVCGNRRAAGRKAGPQHCVDCIVMKNLLDGCGRETPAAPSSDETRQEE